MSAAGDGTAGDAAGPGGGLAPGPVAGPAAGPWAEAIGLAFKVIFALVLLAALAWPFSNVRQVYSDSRAVVLRFGRVARVQGAGLPLAWPRPFERVVFLPAPERQLEYSFAPLRPPGDGRGGAAGTHPVSRALAALVPAERLMALDELRELPGFGVTASHDGAVLAMGRPELFGELGIEAPPPPEHDGPIAGIADGGRFIRWMLLADEPRLEAEAALEDLRRLGLRRMLLLAGDRAPVARRIASLLRIPDYRAEALPQEKLDRVLEETRAGYRPMVVGDGINDSLALKAGAVGVAMGGHGTDAALASADLVLMTSNLRRLATCVRLSRRCRTTIHVNVGLGLGWTAATIALAAAGVLGPSGALVAAVAHNVGTLAVMANAGRLLKFQDT